MNHATAPLHITVPHRNVRLHAHHIAVPHHTAALGLGMDGDGNGNGSAGFMQGINGDPGTLPKVELSEVERERPFACGVGECQRRYKNIHGLRYHYHHSEIMGLRGLR